MDFKEVLSYWKLILGLIVVSAGATISVITYAEDQKALIEAKQQLMHNTMYQESRIDRKKDIIADNRKIIKAIESDDDEPSLQEQKYVEFLREEIVRLEKDIEEIRAKLRTGNE